MRIWYAALVVLCCMSSVGCRTSQHVAALQRDNRLKEDEIYRLRWQLEDYQEELDRYQQGQQAGTDSPFESRSGETLLERLRARTAPTHSASPELSVEVGETISPDEFLKSRDVETPDTGPSLFLPEPATNNDDNRAPPPAWTEPEETTPGDEAPQWSPPSGQQEPSDTTRDTRLRVPPVEQADAAPPRAVLADAAPLPTEEAGNAAPQPPAEQNAAPLPTENGGRPAQLRIDPDATGGHNLDAQPGDDGLQIVFHPLDESGHLLRVPAAVSIVLLDPALEGEAARVARWDFTEDEVAAAIRASGNDEGGIPLKVVWRDRLPQNEVLSLFVRYTTADGRKLEDQIEVRIRLTTSPTSAGWKTVPQQNPPPPPEEDRSTNNPEQPSDHTRFASRSLSVARQPSPRESAPRESARAPEPRLKRPKWSPDRP